MAKAPQPCRIGLDLGEKSLSALSLRPDGRLHASITALADETTLASTLAALHADATDASEVVLTSSRGFSALRTPPRIALLITEGFEDILRLHDAPFRDLEPIFGLPLREICPRERVLGVPERLHADGSVARTLTAEALFDLQKRVAALEVSAIAVVLLHSYQNDAHERTIAEALSPLGLPIALSSDRLRVLDERRRTAATLIDAAVAATHQAERAALSGCPSWRVLYSDSAGDLTLASQTTTLGQLFSTVTAGLRGAQRIATGHGMSRFLALHMLDSFAVVALHDSTLLVDAPSGAGRDLEPWAEVPAQELRLIPLAEKPNADAREAAIFDALAAITLDRGHDPAAYPLLGYGHVTAPLLQPLAERLGTAAPLVLPSPQLVAAYGALCAPLVSAGRELLAVEASAAQQTGQIVATLSTLTSRLRDELGQKGYVTSAYLTGLEWLAEMRYQGQRGHTLLLTGLGDGSPAPSGDTDLVVRFCVEHKRRYGFLLSECPVEIVALRVRVTLPVSTPSYSEFVRLKALSVSE